MLFGQSIFQSVLDRLDAEDVGEDEVAAHRIHGLNAGFATDVREGVSAGVVRPDQAYLDNIEPERPTVAEVAPVAPPEPAAEPVLPAYLSRTAPEDVAAELAISPVDTVQSLNDKRRAFAKANHPDGIAPAFRDKATARMTIANLLIDDALRRLSRSPR